MTSITYRLIHHYWQELTHLIHLNQQYGPLLHGAQIIGNAASHMGAAHAMSDPDNTDDQTINRS